MRRPSAAPASQPAWTRIALWLLVFFALRCNRAGMPPVEPAPSPPPVSILTGAPLEPTASPPAGPPNRPDTPPAAAPPEPGAVPPPPPAAAKGSHPAKNGHHAANGHGDKNGSGKKPGSAGKPDRRPASEPEPRPKPEPPGEPPRAEKPHSGPSAPERALTWNLWAEAGGTAISLKPVATLRPQRRSAYRVVLDLAGLSYALAGVASRAAGKRLVDALDSSELDEVELQLLFLPSPTFFPNAAATWVPIKIDMARKRTDFANPEALPEGTDPLQYLRKRGGKAPFSYARVKLPQLLSTADHTGMAPIAVSIWDGERPLDEFVVRLCISKDEQGTECQEQKGVQTAQSRMALQPAQGPRDRAAAGLHFLRRDDSILAVFRSVGPGSILRAVSPEEWQVWTLTGEAQLRETLHRQLAQYQDAKTDAHMRGAAHRISNLLLRQNGEPGYVPAVANYLRQEMMRTDGPRPKLFVRMVQNTAEAPLPIPLGIAALASSDNSPDSASPAAGVVSAGPRLLGERFDIRMSLEQQYPDRPTGCIQRWVSVVPSEKTNEIDAATRELLGALQKRKYSSQLTSLCETPGNCYREYSDLVHFLSVPQAAAEPSTVLTLLSHHGLGAYSMQAEGPYSPQQHLTEQDLARTFTEPSLAILVACASGAVDAAPFLRGFNRLGFSSIIATHTSISVALAADFMDCFMDAVEHAAPADTLDSVFYRATQECLRSRPNPDDRDSEISPARPYGAQALKFFLAGSRNIRVCPPNTQARSPK